MSDTPAASPSTAVVLAGGGALGAYEAGALRYTLDELSRDVDVQPAFNMFTGTSVGALNSCFLAARADEPAEGARALTRYWRTVTLDRVVRFRLKEVASLSKLVFGSNLGLPSLPRPFRRPDVAPHRPVAGIFDTAPLRSEMLTAMPWDRLGRNIDRGVVRGIALCATEVCTGGSVIFYQVADGVGYKVGRDPSKEARRVRIGAEHAMASAAIPFLFPSVQVDGVCYTDGALRQNTPINPALRMGAQRILVISLTQDPGVASGMARLGCRMNPYPGALFLLGKTVHALLEQSLDYELNRIETYNRLILGGREVYGDDFIVNLNKIIGVYRNADYRPVRTAHIRPSRDLHALALQAIQDAPDELVLPGLTGRLVARILGSTAIAESNLLSYLMFTPTYIRTLLELGYDDAKAHRETLVRLFAEDR